MFNSISRGVFASSTRFTRVARFLHQVPKLESHETWTQEGIPGFCLQKVITWHGPIIKTIY